MVFEKLRGLFTNKKGEDEPVVDMTMSPADLAGEDPDIVFEEVGETEKGVDQQRSNENAPLPQDLQMKVDAVTLGLEIEQMKSELRKTKKNIDGMKELMANPELGAENIKKIENNSGQSISEEITRFEAVYFNYQVQMAEKELALAKMAIDLAKLGVKDKAPIPVSTTAQKSRVSVWNSDKRAFDNTRWNVATFNEQSGVYGVTRGQGSETKTAEIPRADLEAWQTSEGHIAMKNYADRKGSLEEVQGILNDHMEGRVVDARQNAYDLSDGSKDSDATLVADFFEQGDKGAFKGAKRRRRKKRGA